MRTRNVAAATRHDDRARAPGFGAGVSIARRWWDGLLDLVEPARPGTPNAFSAPVGTSRPLSGSLPARATRGSRPPYPIRLPDARGQVERAADGQREGSVAGGGRVDGQPKPVPAWWMGIFPGRAVMLTVLAINVLGDWLRDYQLRTLRNV